MQVTKIEKCRNQDVMYVWPRKLVYANLRTCGLIKAIKDGDRLARVHCADKLDTRRLSFGPMEFIKKLRQIQVAKRSVRKILLQYGNKDSSNYGKPLLQLSVEEITTLILNWIPKVLKKNETVRVRMRAEQHVYEIDFK